MKEYKEIQLSQGYVTIVDNDDYDRLMKMGAWCVNVEGKGSRFYAVRDIVIQKKTQKTTYKRKRVRMHRIIMNAPDGVLIDHVDGDGLNNRKKNLRFATHQENMKNRKLSLNSTCGYKGVCFEKYNCKWRARIGINGKQKHLGYYETKEDAAKAYNDSAIENFGEFARLNIIKKI
jgi:hypothetical protein